MPVQMLSTSAMASSSTSSKRSTPDALTSVSFASSPRAATSPGRGDGRPLEALLLDGALLGLLDVVELALELLQVRRRAHALDAQAAAGLVDEVDRLVGEVSVADVAVGEVRRGDDRLVGDRDPVVRLVLVAHALQDLDRVRQRRLLDLDGLEAALERGVLLEVLAVLVGGRRADRLQLAAASIGFRIEAASIAPSAAPAPTRVWISSMNSTMSPRVLISLSTFLRRSSKSPR
jgi:hypothetical protein